MQGSSLTRAEHALGHAPKRLHVRRTPQLLRIVHLIQTVDHLQNVLAPREEIEVKNVMLYIEKATTTCDEQSKESLERMMAASANAVLRFDSNCIS